MHFVVMLLSGIVLFFRNRLFLFLLKLNFNNLVVINVDNRQQKYIHISIQYFRCQKNKQLLYNPLAWYTQWLTLQAIFDGRSLPPNSAGSAALDLWIIWSDAAGDRKMSRWPQVMGFEPRIGLGRFQCVDGMTGWPRQICTLNFKCKCGSLERLLTHFEEYGLNTLTQLSTF